MAMHARGVSVIVPTHSGRFPFLSRLMASLEVAAARAGEPVETIVIDDSPEPEASSNRRLCDAHGARYLRGPRPAGAKRNIGLASAMYDVLLFTDSDCVAHSDLIREHLKVVRSSLDDVAGVVGLCRFAGRGRWFWRLAGRSGRYNSCFDWPLVFEQVLWGATANLCVRTSVMLKSGGFDESAWTVVGGEDGSACIAMVDRGYRLLTAPAAVVLHGRDHMRSVMDLMRSMLRYGAADAYLCDRFPHRSRRVLTPPLFIILGLLLGTLLQAVSVPAGIWLGLLGAFGGLAVRDFVAQRERSQRVSRIRYAWDVDDAYDADLVTMANSKDVARSTPRNRGTRRQKATVLEVSSDIACVVLDWTFDIGAALMAMRRGRMRLLYRRFGYMDAGTFVRRSPALK